MTPLDLVALPLVCRRDRMFLALSKASLKDSKHFIKISPPILFYPGAANEGVESFANLSQFELPWLSHWRRRQCQLGCLSENLIS